MQINNIITQHISSRRNIFLRNVFIIIAIMTKCILDKGKKYFQRQFMALTYSLDLTMQQQAQQTDDYIRKPKLV